MCATGSLVDLALRSSDVRFGSTGHLMGMTGSGAKRPLIRKRDLVSTTNEYKTIQFPTGKEIAKPCQSAQARAGRSPRDIRGILERMTTPQTAAEDVFYRRKSGKYLLVPSISQFDP